MDLREIGWWSVDRTQLAQDRDWWWALVNTMGEPLGSGAMELVIKRYIDQLSLYQY
jgi:hypothetical protein